MEDDLFQKNI